MVKEFTAVSSTVLILACRISSDRPSNAAMTFTACPGARCDTVLTTRFAPANSTFTSGRRTPPAAGSAACCLLAA
uniref:Uncharacterized protein n=1 Tax=Arundo donax TaxID=35708 RepID=A0A0A9D164_ARUDO